LDVRENMRQGMNPVDFQHGSAGVVAMMAWCK
jgi:hypothetical protein